MRDMLLTRWTEVGDKLLQLADAFPGERYDARPADGVRTFAEQVRHVAFWNAYAAGSLRGESPDGAANELSPAEYATKPVIVRALRDSVDAVSTQLKANGGVSAAAADTVVSFIEHSGEHYGQLAMYCRLNAIVPPASRG